MSPEINADSLLDIEQSRQSFVSLMQGVRDREPAARDADPYLVLAYVWDCEARRLKAERPWEVEPLRVAYGALIHRLAAQDERGVEQRRLEDVKRTFGFSDDHTGPTISRWEIAYQAFDRPIDVDEVNHLVALQR